MPTGPKRWRSKRSSAVASTPGAAGVRVWAIMTRCAPSDGATPPSGAPNAPLCWLRSDALVEIWQAGSFGRYLLPKDAAAGPRDPNFQGYGQARTDATGAYRFRTIRPVPYESRPPHIHFQVTHPRFRPLVTQMYVVGETGRENPAYFGGQRVRDALSVTLRPAESAESVALAARFDIVLTPSR